MPWASGWPRMRSLRLGVPMALFKGFKLPWWVKPALIVAGFIPIPIWQAIDAALLAAINAMPEDQQAEAKTKLTDAQENRSATGYKRVIKHCEGVGCAPELKSAD